MMPELLIIEIDKGKDVKKEIELFIKSRKLIKAIIIGAVGSITNIALSVPIDDQLPPKIERSFFNGPAEILSFSGEVMDKSLIDSDLRNIYLTDGLDLFIHIHASIGVKGAEVHGGGLVEAKVFRGLNVFCIPVNY